MSDLSLLSFYNVFCSLLKLCDKCVESIIVSGKKRHLLVISLPVIA